jgi:hypothetical protein
MTPAVAAGAETSQILMPGGGVARRPLHFIVMADCSGPSAGSVSPLARPGAVSGCISRE